MEQDNPQQAELAYTAGIWEGEGSTAAYIGSGPTRSGLVFVASVWQSNYKLLDWLHERFGGGVYGRRGAGYGKDSRKKTGEWRVTGHATNRFLLGIRPYIVFRSAEIDVMLCLWEYRQNREIASHLCDERKRVRAAAETEWSDTRKRELTCDATVRSAGTIQPAEDVRNDVPPLEGGQ